jgi:outer membrane protein OmpA-like peptidoglycan-associated protein
MTIGRARSSIVTIRCKMSRLTFQTVAASMRIITLIPLWLVFAIRLAKKKPMAAVAPAPAPAPAESAPIARNYIVFFDWDSATISDEAIAILKSAAENARKGNISRIQATGHADTSGTRRYNQKLSEKRAQAVRTQLNSLGIATNQVAVAGKG